VMGDVTGSIVDVLKGRAGDKIAQKRAARQFEAIGEKVGESLLPVFEMDGAGLDESARTAVALEVASTLNRITSAMVTKRDLEPRAVAKQLLEERPAKVCGFSEAEGLLYERTVRESCEYIVDIAKDLPQFTERTFAEILSREGQLLEIAEKILMEVARMRAAQDTTLEESRFELEYLRAVIRKLDELQLFGSGVSVTSRRYSLSLAYITLSVEKRVRVARELQIQSKGRLIRTLPKTEGSEFGTEEELAEEIVRQTEAVDEALKNTQSALIIGDAGSGKTTLLQWIAVQAAKHTLPESLHEWNMLVPFYVRLRQHVAGSDVVEPKWPMPEELVRQVAPTIAGEMPSPKWAHQLLKSGRAVVLVDGIDEVPEAQRESVYRWLNDLMDSFPKAHFVVTSRPYAVEEGELRRKELVHATLQPMKIEDIELFVGQWHAAIRENIQDEEERMLLPEAAERLKKEIRETSAVRLLAKNPLLCAMLCALNWERHQQLPSNRIALYEACCELLIQRRDLERRISLEQYPAAALAYEQKVFLLSDLAYWFVRNGLVEASVEDVDERFTVGLKRLVGNVQKISGTDARQLFSERSGIIRMPTADEVDFTHRTFQEYLTAKAIVYEGDIGMLVKQAHDDQWQEIIVMAASLLAKKGREELVKKLMKRGERGKKYCVRLFALAGMCAQAAQEEVDAKTKAQLQECLKSLVPLQNVEDVELLRQVGELAVPCFEARIQYSKEVAVACVNALTSIGSEAAYENLESYSNDFTPEVVNAMILGLENAKNKEEYSERFLNRFEYLHINSNNKLLQYTKFMPQISSLHLWNLSTLSDLTFLTQFPTLSDLSLFNLPALSDISILSQIPNLSSLFLGLLPEVPDLSMLSQIPNLSSLSLGLLPEVPDLSILSQIPNLTSLTLGFIPDLSIFLQIPNLSSLSLGSISNIDELSIVAKNFNLSSLSIDDLSSFSDFYDLSILTNLYNLSSLSLSDLSNISDTSDIIAFADLPNLSSLFLDHLNFYNVPFLKYFSNLSSLSLKRANFPDLPSLIHFSNLSSLSLKQVHLSDLSILKSLKNLTHLELEGDKQIWDFTVLSQLEKLERVELSYFDYEPVLPEKVKKVVVITGRRFDSIF
jgi:hypothetical protein